MGGATVLDKVANSRYYYQRERDPGGGTLVMTSNKNSFIVFFYFYFYFYFVVVIVDKTAALSPLSRCLPDRFCSLRRSLLARSLVWSPFLFLFLFVVVVVAAGTTDGPGGR